MIAETLTLRFQDEEQQRRFHERLNEPDTSEVDAAAVQSFEACMRDIVDRAVQTERLRCAAIANAHIKAAMELIEIAKKDIDADTRDTLDDALHELRLAMSACQ